MPPYLYVSTWGADNAMVIVDACPTCAPAFVGVLQHATINGPSGISVYGRYAYIPCQYSDNLVIADVSDPTNPTYVSHIGGPGFPNYLNSTQYCHVRNNGLCYVVSGLDNALSIFDVSNPATPTLVSVLRGAGAPPGGNWLGFPKSIFVDDNLLAYIAAQTDNSLTIIDVSNPAAPAFVGNIAGVGGPNFLSSVRDVVVRGIYAYTVAWADKALSIFNIANPAAPFFVGTITHASLNGVQDLYIYGNYAYTTALNSNALGIFNILNPATPAFVSQLIDGRFQSPSNIIVPEGAYPRAYILGGNVAADSCCRLDVSNPAAPAYVNWLQGSGPPNYMTTPQYITENQTFLPIVQTLPATEIT